MANPGSAPRVWLLDTTGFLPGGSMSRYLDLLESGLGANAEHGWELRRQRVGLPLKLKGWIPARLRAPLHHLLAFVATYLATRVGRPDLVHVIDGSHAYLIRALPARCAAVATIHDLIPLLQAEGALGPLRPSPLGHRLALLGLRALERADALMTDSDSTRNDLTRRSPNAAARARVVHLALRAQAAGRLPLGVPGSYVLHVGNDGFYKNRDGLLRIFARMADRTKAHMVLVGPPLSEGQRAFLSGEGLSERVHCLDGVDETALGALYRNAGLFLFPSLYEGYGWPPLEAMAVGCPTVCSDRASLPELVGDAAVLADPEDEAGFAAAALALLNDPAKHADLCRRGPDRVKRFSLEAMSIAVAAVYADALRNRKKR